MSDSKGGAGGELTVPNGLAVKSGAYLCAEVFIASRGKPPVDVTLQGYLADDLVIRPVPRKIYAPPVKKGGTPQQPTPTKK